MVVPTDPEDVTFGNPDYVVWLADIAEQLEGIAEFADDGLEARTLARHLRTTAGRVKAAQRIMATELSK